MHDEPTGAYARTKRYFLFHFGVFLQAKFFKLVYLTFNVSFINSKFSNVHPSTVLQTTKWYSMIIFVP